MTIFFWLRPRDFGAPSVGWEFQHYAGRWLLADREKGVFVMVRAEWSRVNRCDVVAALHIARWDVCSSAGALPCPALLDPRTAILSLGEQSDLLRYGGDYDGWRRWVRGDAKPVPSLMVA